MSFYEDRVLPRLLHLTMRQARFEPYRRRCLDGAHGSVLEIGLGSGLNLPFYGDATVQLIGLDPSRRLLAMARRGPATAHGGRSVELVEGSAEAIPLDDRSVDALVSTWTLCSIPDIEAALREMRRVLKPGGQLHFVEHGLAPDPRVRRWQQRLTPMWKRLAGGCHLDRPIRDLVEAAGFRLDRLDTGYMARPRSMAFMYEGRAVRPSNG